MNHLLIVAKKSWIVLLIIGSALIFQSCEEMATDTSTNNSGTVQQPKKTRPIISTEPDVKALEKIAQKIEHEEFNRSAKKAAERKEIWTSSPELTLLKFVGETMNEMHTREIRLESINGSESVTEVLATVMEDGYMDDSVRGALLIVRMKKNNSNWNIVKAGQVFRCRQNRGHLEYGIEPCK